MRFKKRNGRLTEKIGYWGRSGWSYITFEPKLHSSSLCESAQATLRQRFEFIRLYYTALFPAAGAGCLSHELNQTGGTNKMYKGNPSITRRQLTWRWRRNTYILAWGRLRPCDSFPSNSAFSNRLRESRLCKSEDLQSLHFAWVLRLFWEKSTDKCVLQSKQPLNGKWRTYNPGE